MGFTEEENVQNEVKKVEIESRSVPHYNEEKIETQEEETPEIVEIDSREKKITVEVERQQEISIPQASKVDDDEYDEDEQDEKEDAAAPVVSKDRLIGGAEVEWTEPDTSNKHGKFGLPPE